MAFSFERKILKSSDLQEWVRINDIIMFCHLCGSEKNSNNDNKKPQQLSLLKKHKHFISPAGHLLAIKSVLGTEPDERRWFRRVGEKCWRHWRPSGKVTLGGPGPLQAMAGGAQHWLSLCWGLECTFLHLSPISAFSPSVCRNLVSSGPISRTLGSFWGLIKSLPCLQPTKGSYHLQDKVLTL